jgi:proteasome alpha subunit
MYVPPEQLIRDRAEFARAGVGRGRPVVVLGYRGGIALVAANPSRSLHKVAEIYDRIAFAAVGQYHEFEALRVAGVRYTDLRGYAYARQDVTARSLVGAYAATLGQAFTQGAKPLEVELAVAEVGADQASDQLFRLRFDGAVTEEPGLVVMGGGAERIGAELKRKWKPGLTLPAALRLAVAALGRAGSGAADAVAPGGARRAGFAADAVGTGGAESSPRSVAGPGGVDAGSGGPGRPPAAEHIEAAVLDRAAQGRAFRRLPQAQVASALGGASK